ncbi:MAG: cbb3-type cytochrome c oxidase subunit II [Deferribacteraceae bacterium]|jgi:cytochrome c oxidase cbb3-type subunit 2|nr:cbb3-type cytochrome c oxidase subunit II [Deferribacteraceae bacterium]
MSENQNSIFSRPLLFSVLVLAVILVGSIVTAFYPLARDDMHPRIEERTPYTAIEFAGRDVYLREGCVNCHTQTVRPLKSEVLRYGDYSKGGESADERPFLWGSRRTGPDLSRIGGKYIEEWHLQHFVNPQKFAAVSNMPKYTWLADRLVDASATETHMKGLGLEYAAEDMTALAEMTELQALAAYMLSIGRGVERLSLVEITYEDFDTNGNPASGQDGAAVRGRQLFVSECSGCHGIDAEGDLAMPLTGLGGTDMDEGYVFVTIAGGFEGMMPNFVSTMTRMQIGSIVEYLKTLNEDVVETPEEVTTDMGSAEPIE